MKKVKYTCNNEIQKHVKERSIMSTIALKGKYFMKGSQKKSVFKEFVEAYRENQAEVICGVLGVSGNPSAALRMYQLLSK